MKREKERQQAFSLFLSVCNLARYCFAGRRRREEEEEEEEKREGHWQQQQQQQQEVAQGAAVWKKKFLFLKFGKKSTKFAFQWKGFFLFSFMFFCILHVCMPAKKSQKSRKKSQ